MRTIDEIRSDIRELKRNTHTIRCGELREIAKKYGDKKIYLVNSSDEEVPGQFRRVHDFVFGFRWELHESDSVTTLAEEAFRQWGGYIDTPVQICETMDQGGGACAAFGEYTICGDCIVFRRNRDAFKKIHSLREELNKAESAESDKRMNQLLTEGLSLPLVKKPFAPLFEEKRTMPDLLANHIVGVQPVSGPIGFARSLRKIYGSN